MTRRVTQVVMEVLGAGGDVRATAAWLTCIAQVDAPMKVTALIAEMLRTPESTAHFLPVTMIING